MKRWLLVATLAGCGSDPQPPHALGMNDVSILMPLPTDATVPVLTGLFDQAVPLADPIWFDAMVFTRGDLGSKEHDYFNDHSFHVVAVRVDLCDRVAATPCPDGVDGRLRLVAQPIVVSSTGSIKVLDIGVHLFYPIPAADLADVIDELRELAAIQATPDGPLHVSLAAAAGSAEYLTRLRALVLRYATAANLVRFTANGQKATSVGNSWLFRQLDRSTDGINYDMALIPNANAYEQDALLQGGDTSYVSDQVTDTPHGFANAIDGLAFMAATPADQAASVDAIAAMENPTLHDAFDTQCLGCHVGSYIGSYRATELGIDPATSPSWYYSSHDLTVPASSPTSIRGFGYFGTDAVISQAVANETANVLDEISARSTF